MSRWVILTAPHPDDTDDRLAAFASAAAASPRVTHCSAGVDLPGSTGGQGAVWDLTTDSAPAAVLPGLTAAADVVPLAPVHARVVRLDARRRVKRTLLLTVREGTSPETVSRFESDLMAMPAHIPAIKSWSLSRVPGHARWTHVWEQEFTDPDGLNGDYLLHPYHWTHVDRWFDAEIPGSIVDPAIAHLYRWARDPVLGS
ncbi:Dabb family protein [Nocardia tengchongensis]|uniref:Dabb family protein n=1 Tax=Nocardia tengchongensis TaxID=2055889 RepID=UPI0036ACD077